MARNKQGAFANFLLGFLAIGLALPVYLIVKYFFLVSVLVVLGLMLRLLMVARFFSLARRVFKHDECIFVKAQDGESKLNRSYNKYLELSDYFLLCFSGNGFSVIPKRAFAIKAGLKRFRELLNNHIHK